MQWCNVWVVTLRVCASASAIADNKRPRQRSQRQKAGCVRENAGAGRLVARVGWVRSRANPQPTAGIKIEAPSGPANQAAGRDQGQDVSKRGLQGPTSKTPSSPLVAAPGSSAPSERESALHRGLSSAGSRASSNNEQCTAASRGFGCTVEFTAQNPTTRALDVQCGLAGRLALQDSIWPPKTATSGMGPGTMDDHAVVGNARDPPAASRSPSAWPAQWDMGSVWPGLALFPDHLVGPCVLRFVSFGKANQILDASSRPSAEMTGSPGVG